MKLKLPTASRKRLDTLLEYLGDRAGDFKKCFDIESEWCWKYADLVLRGMKKRNLEYAEGHHVVPASFYGKRGCNTVDDGNITVLSYGEHLWAHYCLTWCATDKMRGKMARAFLSMYNIGVAGSRPLIPSEAELLDAIPEMELKRIRTMEPQWAKVEAEGRTHKSEDPKQYRKDYYEANREKRIEYVKTYSEANREKIAEYQKAYREVNKDKLSEYFKVYNDANKEKKKAYREANKEKIAEKYKAYYNANKEKNTERCKAYRDANREKIRKRCKAYRDANREKIIAHKKAYREAKKAAGYRYRKDPVTGKKHLVFVGLPATPETPKSTSGAA